MIELATQANGLALSKPVLLKELLEELRVPVTRWVDWVLVPALKGFFLRQARRIVDMFVQIDVVLHIALLGMHVLPALRHVLALFQAAVEGHQSFVERSVRVMDPSPAFVSIGAPARTSVDLVQESRRTHG